MACQSFKAPRALQGMSSRCSLIALQTAAADMRGRAFVALWSDCILWFAKWEGSKEAASLPLFL